MLKIFRRSGRTKKIGVLNFFLLVIIVIILGFSFLFIHEESYSLNNYLFKSKVIYALKEPPLKLKKMESSQELHLFDLISVSQFKDLFFDNYSGFIKEDAHCQQLFNIHDPHWMAKIKMSVEGESNCPSTMQLKPKGLFLPWRDHNLYVEIFGEEEKLEACAGHFVLPLKLKSQTSFFPSEGFESVFSEEEALQLMKLRPIRLLKLQCSL